MNVSRIGPAFRQATTSSKSVRGAPTSCPTDPLPGRQ